MLSKRLEKGDHIYQWSSNYERHGTYDGNGKVIHLSVETKTIIETPFLQFVGGRKYYLRRADPCDSPDTVVRRAKAFLGKRIKRVTARSPEHFVVYCQSGRILCNALQIWAPSPNGSKRTHARRFDSGGPVAALPKPKMRRR